MAQLDFIQKLLAISGIIIWLIIGYDWITKSESTKLSLPVKNKIELEHILVVIFAFLLIAGLLLQAMSSIKLRFTPNEEINKLAQQILADMIAKTTVLSFMIYLYIKKIEIHKNVKATNKANNFIKIALISTLLYFAIFPAVNVGMFSFGIYLVRDILGISINTEHPAFRLLSSSAIGIYPKIMCLILAAIVSPVAEELFFRGLLQNWILNKTHSLLLSITLASLGFMIVHIPMYHQLPALWLLGVILGWAYWRYGTIYIPIITHIIFNTATLIMWHLQA